MGLHVFLHIGLLGEGSAAHDALEGLLTCVTECRRHCSCSQWKEEAIPRSGLHYTNQPPHQPNKCFQTLTV